MFFSTKLNIRDRLTNKYPPFLKIQIKNETNIENSENINKRWWIKNKFLKNIWKYFKSNFFENISQKLI